MMVALTLVGQNFTQSSHIGTTEPFSENWSSKEENISSEKTINSTSQIAEVSESIGTTETKKISSSETKEKDLQNQSFSVGDTENDPIIVNTVLTTTTAGKFYKVIFGGSINTVVSGSKIVEMTGGTITSLSGSIGIFTGGTVGTMNIGSVIETLNGGSVTRANANSKINLFLSGNVAETRMGSKIETMSGGSIPKCNGNVDTLTGDGKITNLYGTVSIMSGGEIRNLSGTVTTMNGGSVVYTLFFSTVTTLNGGVIEAHDDGATIGQLNGGRINKSYGTISAMIDGLVVYYQGSIPDEGNRGNATVLNASAIETLIKDVSNHVYDGTAPYDFQSKNQWEDFVTFTYNDQETPPSEVGQSYVVKANIHYSGEFVTSMSGGTFAITPKELSFSDIKVADKIYDGKTTAVISQIELTGVLPSDNKKVQVDLSKSKAYLDQKDVGDQISGSVQTENIILTGDKAHNYKLTDHQSIPITAKITPFQISSNSIIFSEQYKSYDGEIKSNLIGHFKEGIVQTNDSNLLDELTLEIVNAEYSDARIGEDKLISYDWGLLGKDAINYTLEVRPQVIGGITEPIITEEIIEKIIDEVQKQTPQKEYDGATKGQFILDISELFASNAVEVIELVVQGDYKTKDVGDHGFTVASWEIKDGKAVIEDFPATPIVLSGKINPKPVTLDWTADAKEYDGGEAATIHGEARGIVAGDSVSFTGEGSFTDKHVGMNKTVQISKILASDKDAGNYSYSRTDKTTASIFPKELQTGWSSKDKIYDGQRTAEVHAELTGLIKDDDVVVTGKGTFVDDRVGEKKAITIIVSTTGDDSKNYVVSDEGTTTGTIQPKLITITGVKAIDRVLSDSLSVDLDGRQAKLSGVISKDQEKIGFTLNKGTIETAEIGQNKSVKTDIQLIGDASGNYRLIQPDLMVTILAKGSATDSSRKTTQQSINPQQQIKKTMQQLRSVQASTKKNSPSNLLKTNDSFDVAWMWTGVGIVGLTGIMFWLRRRFYK